MASFSALKDSIYTLDYREKHKRIHTHTHECTRTDDCQYLSVRNVLYKYLERRTGTIIDEYYSHFFSFLLICLSSFARPNIFNFRLLVFWFWLHFFFHFLILTLHLHGPFSFCFLIHRSSHHHFLLQLLPFILTPNGLSLINRVLYSLSHSRLHRPTHARALC